MKRKVEICCGSYEDCLCAARGKADRVELNSALHLGGLTPSIGTLKLVKEEIALPVICMVRPRGAGFHYTDAEVKVMFEDAKALLDAKADGLAFGFLFEDGSIDVEKNKRMVDLIHSYHKEAVFHRAFDCAKDPFEAMEALIAIGVDRVLTSGLEAKAYDGRALIKQLQEKYGQQIEILAGSGVNASNAKALMDETGIQQVHSSCKAWVKDPTTNVNSGVTYAYASGDLTLCYDVVSEDLVKQIVASI